VAYDFGLGEDASWTAAFMSSAHPDSRIHIFDPTPRAMLHWKAVESVVRDGLGTYVEPE